MPFYHTLGNIPPKRHTQFRKEDGNLYHEQLFGTIGFDGMYTNSYHEQRPTQVKEIKKQYSVAPKVAKKNNMQSFRFRGFQVPPEKDYLTSRKAVLTNSDCTIILAAPQESQDDYFYKNADADELIFVHKGSGKLRTHLGNLDFKYGDYLLIPRGMIYKMQFNDDDNRLFIVESRSPIYTPKRYRNWFGQLLEHSPFCERDLRKPHELETHNEEGDFLIKLKKGDDIFEMVYSSHPFDVVGYDGYNYPYAFSIHDFEPITGRVHQPPPVHQTFETDAFVANCHKIPQKQFLKELLSVETISESIEAIITLIRKMNPKVSILFTVSPVRHLKDGFIENTQSKSHVISAIHQVVEPRKQLYYFPSYEIMMDELRDYRFYKDDMIHPNGLAINYIWNKFQEVWISESSKEIMQKIDEIQKGIHHKPFNSNSESHKQFLQRLEEKKSLIIKDFPFIKF